MAYLVLICSMNVLCQFYVYMYAGILLEDIAFNFDIATIIFFILERVIFSQVVSKVKEKLVSDPRSITNPLV